MTLKLNGTNSEAAPAYAGDDADTGLQCGTNELKLVTGGTARATVDSSGNIGVGVTPSSWGGSRNAIQFDSTAAAYICNDEAMAIVSNMYFNGSNNKYINTNPASQVLFQTGSTQFLYAGSGTAGNNISFSTAATIDTDGIKFQGDTASANALDDYEEGDFTATCANSVTLHSDQDLCQYVKIGSMVTVMGQVRVNNSNSSQDLIINNLPFPVINSGSEAAGFSAGSVRLYSADISSLDKYVVAVAYIGTSNLYFYSVRDNAASVPLSATSNGYYMFNITYRAA